MPARKLPGNNEYTHHNRVRMVRGGADYFHAIEHIADAAQHTLHLQTYIYDADETGRKVADALMRAAKRGVHVYVLLDGYASQHLPDEFVKELRDSGVHVDFFSPFFKSTGYYIGRRLHHKVIVADARICMIAGINISNRYNDMGAVKAWLDWAAYAEGEVAHRLNDVCERVWNRSGKRKSCVQAPPPQRPAGDVAVRIRRNDWAFTYTDITKTYREIFSTAKREVTMMTSYFWPPQKLLRRMKAAAARGVKIKVILTARADVPLSKYAERYLYAWLFRHNIAVYEYRPNILHGKLAVCDSEWLTIGSYNVNNISAYASVELNFDIRNSPIATGVQQELQKIIDNDCTEITAADFAKTAHLWSKLAYYLAYRVIHWMFFLFTFYFIQKRDSNEGSK